ncbi:hypothetical protein WG906_04865 [Pedobacter sp. P351]|uniref:hypothetical protein n=1 Tax=Pedobacter superstes TaxID=3133441 RepID=UPI0030B51ADE
MKVRAGFTKVENLSDFHGSELPHLYPGTHLAIAFTVTSNHKDLLDENNVVKIQVTYSDTFKATYLQKVEYIDALFDYQGALNSQDPILLDETVVV